MRATLISSLPGGETKASRADRAERADKGRLGSQRMAKRLARKEAKSLIQLFFSIPGKKYFPPTIPLPLLKERVKKDEGKRWYKGDFRKESWTITLYYDN